MSGDEVITLCLGQCGIELGSRLCDTLLRESQIDEECKFVGTDKSLLNKSSHFFDLQQTTNQYVPRALFFDLDSSSVDSARTSPFGSLLPEDNFVAGASQMGSVTWGHGHYTDGAELIDKAVDSVRKCIEVCNTPQGFQLVHGVCGGVGGGFGSLLLLKLRDNYFDLDRLTHSVWPSRYMFEQQNINLIVYNSLLTVSQMIENASLCLTLDHGKALNLLSRNQQQEEKQNVDMNDIDALLCKVMSGATSSMRFECSAAINTSLHSMTQSLSTGRLRFLSTSVWPVAQSSDKINMDILQKCDLSDVQLPTASNSMLAMSVQYRASNEKYATKVHDFLETARQDKWNNVQHCLIHDDNNAHYKKHAPFLATALLHTPSIASRLARLSSKFAKIYKRRAFLHFYKGEGMDEMEFQEADRNIRKLVDSYNEKRNDADEAQDDDTKSSHFDVKGNDW